MDLIKVRIAFIFVITLSACTPKDEVVFEDYQFEIKGFDWDSQPYKFRKTIQDSVLTKFGHQIASWDYSYIGDVENMLKTWDIDANSIDVLDDAKISSFNTFRGISAKPVIIEKAKSSEIVIINEAHQMPQHRVFTTDLLEELYNEGYRHLGMESFFASKISDSTLMANKYPILTNGYYVKEPQYGNIIRQAIKLGYKVFGYESQGHADSKEREINQAKNIKAYMESNPKGKYLIHCGFSHNAEGNYGGMLEKTMAGRLTEYTGIDPLTINQTKYSEKSVREFENPYYQLTDVNEPTIFVNKDTIFGSTQKGSWFDLSVFHPRTKNFNRPKWLLIGNRKVQKFNFDNTDIHCPCLVFAYIDGEEIGRAVPYDIQETKDKKEVNLILEKGNYNIIVWNMDGKAVKTIIEY